MFGKQLSESTYRLQLFVLGRQKPDVLVQPVRPNLLAIQLVF